MADDGFSAEQLARIIENPAVQQAGKILLAPSTRDAATEIYQNPLKAKIPYYVVGWILFIFILRAWIFSRPMKFFRRMGYQLVTMLALWSGTLIVIPRVILGEAYVTLLRAGWQISDLLIFKR